MDFAQWLESEMKARGWRQADLIKRSGISSGLLSQILSGQRRPGVDTCRAIARAFGLSDMQVLELAGLADAGQQKHGATVEAIATMLDDLPADDLEEIRAIIRVKHDRLQRKK